MGVSDCVVSIVCTAMARTVAGAGPASLLRLIAILSGIYDVLLGGAMLLAVDEVARLAGIPPPLFPINANLNGLFALAVGLGYFAVARRPNESRWYFWIMGPFLKGAGALALLLDVALRGSPGSFLAFAAADGALAGWTGFALARTARG